MKTTAAEIERGWNELARKLHEQFGATLAKKMERTVIQMLANEQQFMDRMDLTPTECHALRESLAKCNQMLADINARDVHPVFSHG